VGNSPEYLAAFYGTLWAGCVVVPLPPDIEPGRLSRIAGACDMQVLLTTPRLLERRDDISKRQVRMVDLRRAPGGPLPLVEPPLYEGQPLVAILFTSGSSGEPKGVMLSDRNLLCNARAIGQYLPIREDDRALSLLPFYHAFGNSVLQTHMLAGATLVVAGSSVYPNSILEAIVDSEATSFSGVPEMYAALLSYSELGSLRMPSLRYMTVAGGSLRPPFALAVAQRIAPAQFYVMYGQTEATARLGFLPPTELQTRAGSIGKAIPGVELRVVNQQGQAAQPGEVGELCARGDNVMLGYWREPGATATAIQDGWLRTGDLAMTDVDGYVFIKGRRSELVKIQGFRTHPREVEDAVLQGFPHAQALAVPYESSGTTRFALYLVAHVNHGLSETEVRQHCLRNLPRPKVPRHIEVLPGWPLNGAGKIDRSALQRRAENLGREESVVKRDLERAA
jgi:acyl-CoA synthetase (AMP-forming)/AMP-acid ligase II